ncbi:MAG TPA: hypothetical protein VNZ64_12225 [Candidatus Acidoferrum sp.]|jgi:hypothetical protein|nr:hypothetical protein [Candidatus Acidoferrum sp.]
MNFKAIDEASLRHLFSSAFAGEVLHLSYLGPVLDSAGAIESSPDCMILDKRVHPFKPLRCEFKYVPEGIGAFSHNGRFEIAIVWSLGPGVTKPLLLEALLKQNECSELIVLTDMKAFRDLPPYSVASLSKLDGIELIRDVALRRDLPTVFAVCIAARLFPDKFELDRMMSLLSTRFPEVKQMKPQGRANVVSACLQTKPPLLEHMHGQFYRWTSEIDSTSGAAALSQLLTKNFLADPPSDDDLAGFRR